MSRRRTLIRRGLLLAAAACVLGVGALLLCDRWVAAAGDGLLFDTAGAVPAHDVALVLGTIPTVDNGSRRNLYFVYRIDAAAELFHAGKVRHILVSGDNHAKDYDEPSAMRDALVERGVPIDSITLDYAGFRTLDSVVRARTVFGQSRIVVVSQRFHCERAVFIARHRGIHAIGFVARSPGSRAAAKVRAREVLARVAAVVDLHVLGTEPKFPGPPEPIALKH
jgi:SanA protein